MALPEVGLTAVIDNLNKFEAGAKAITGAYDDIEKKGNTVAGSTIALGSNLLKLGGIAAGAALAGITALGAAITGFAVTGISKAIDLDQRMANIAATAGVTKDQVGGLKDLIFDLSLNPDLVVNTNQAADAIEVLLANGAKLTDEFGNVTAAGTELATQVVAMSNATGGDFALSASIATDATNVFGLATEDLSKVVDGATGVMIASKFGAEDYALALASAGGIAGGMGVEIEDFNTVIAATASNFNSGSDAGTSFKTFLQRLAAPTDKVKDLMDDLGLTLFDSSGNMRSMSDVVGQLHKALGPLTEAQRAEIAAELGGADAARTVIALSQLTTQEYNNLSNSVNEQGQALKAAATRVDSLSGAWEILQGVIEAIQIQVGDKFLPLIRKVTVGFIDLASKNGPMVVDFFGMIATAIDSFLILAESTITKVKDLFTVFQAGGLFGSRVGSFGSIGLLAALGISPDIIGVIQGVFNQINTAITSFMTGGIFGQLVNTPAGTAQTGGLLRALGFSDETVARIQEVVLTITTIFQGFLDTIMALDPAQVFNSITGAVLGIGAALGGATIAALIAGIGTAIATLATPITAIILASALLGAAWAGNWGGIQEKTFAVWAVIQPILAQLGTWLMTNIPIAIQYLSSLWINTLLPAMTAIWTFVSGTMFPLWLQLQTFLVDIVGFAITNLANQWTNVLIPALTTVWDYISINILPLLASIGEVINAVVNKAIEASAGLWQNILLPAITSVGEWLNTNLMPTLTAIGEYLTSTFGPMLGDTAGGFEGITAAIQGATTFFTDFAASIRNFELPWFLTPGSPTPLETGLSGIASILNGPLKGAFATFGVIGANSVKVLSGLLAGEFILSLQTIEEVVTRLFTIWPTLIDAVQLKITSMISLLSQLQSRSGTTSSAIISGWSLVNSTIGGVVSKLSTAATSLTTITTNASSATTALKSMSAVVFDTLINRLNTLEEKAGEVESGFEGAVEAADELRSVTFSTMGSALNAINSLIEDIIENFYEMASAANAAESAADGATSGAGNNFAGFGGQAALASVGQANGVSPAVTTPARGASGNVTNVTMNNNFGGNTLGSNMDMAQFDSMVLRSLQRLMGA